MIPVILSGGAGTRLWPVSRAKFPKQFCQFFEESLLEKTIRRLIPFGSPWVVTTEDLRTLTTKTYTELELPLQNILFEPQGRNTAPAVGLLLRVLQLRGLENEIVSFFPADHLIADNEVFKKALLLAEQYASRNYIALLGIDPTGPSTGFGYIETDTQNLKLTSNQDNKSIENSLNTTVDLKGLTVLSFREKPDLKTAEEFLRSKRFFWNAGMFVFKASIMISHFKNLLPEVWGDLENLRPDLSNLAQIYSRIKSISLDYGIMEKIDHQICIPCDMGWTDLGSWDDLAQILESDVSSINQAQTLDHLCENNFVFSTYQKTVGLVGVKDLIVVDTPDALMIAQKGKTQNIKNLVDQLKNKQSELTTDHLFEIRPWGRFEVLRDETHFKSKVITVNPHSQISYQSHDKREELWVIVRGVGEVIIEGEARQVQSGEFVKIPLKAKHRIKNNSDQPLEFVEVQTGTYFGEDDIVRYQDDYGRIE